MKSDRTDHFFIYPKDNHGHRLGISICILLRDGMMFEGTTICSPEDQFSKKEGRKISYQRALEIFSKVTGKDITGQNIYDCP